MNFKDGSIILLNRKGKSSSFYSAAQRFFTGYPFTHSAIIVDPVRGLTSVLSSNEVVTILPLQNYFDEPDTDIMIYELIGFDEYNIKESVDSIYKSYAGASYGYLQITWFVFRWLCKRIGIDIKGKRNYAPNGMICSEMVWDYMSLLKTNYTEFYKFLNEWTKDTVHVGDISEIIKSFPYLFKLVYEKKNNQVIYTAE